MSTDSANSSMGKTRPVIGAKLKGPGPGRYGLPSAFGNSGADRTRKVPPAFTFGSRPTDKKSQDTPGPHYIDPTMSRHGRGKGAAFSMSSRPRSSKKFSSPGPGSYATEGIPPPRQRKSPAYSIGARTSSARKPEIPSPNNYMVPGSLGKTFAGKQKSAPSHTMGMRHTIGSFSSDSRKTPGPGTYNYSATTRKKAPAYSMGGRTTMPRDKTQTPGPGTHSPERVTVHQKRGPAFSMGVRHSEYTTPLIVDIPPE